MYAEYKENFHLICILLSIIGFWSYWRWKRRNMYKCLSKFPQVKGIPIIGTMFPVNIFSLLQFFQNHMQQLRATTFCIWPFQQPLLYTTDPEVIEIILNSPSSMEKAKRVYTALTLVFKSGLITDPVATWKRHRKIISPAFRHNVLLSFIPIFNKFKNRTLENISLMVNNGEHELRDFFLRISFRITMETILDKNLDKDDEIVETIVKILHYFLQTLMVLVGLSIIRLGGLVYLFKRFRYSRRYLENFITDHFNEASKKIENQVEIQTLSNDDAISIKKKPKTFMHQILESYKAGEISLQEIEGEMITMSAAATETSANAINTCILMLAMHPVVQRRLFEEIVSVFPEKDFKMEYEHFDKLPYLDMVINETMRIFSPLPFIARQVEQNIELNDGRIIPKNVTVFIFIYHLHRSKELWGPNAENFDPEHFSPENLKEKHPYSFIPFSKGPRMCIGWRYSLFNMKAQLAGLVRNFRFETKYKLEDLQPFANFSIGFKVQPTLKIYNR